MLWKDMSMHNFVCSGNVHTLHPHPGRSTLQQSGSLSPRLGSERGEQAVFHQAKGWYVTNIRWWRVNNEMGCGLLTMFTVLEVERRSVLWKLLSDVLKLKKLDFLAVKVLGSLTEPANFWFSAQLTWLHSFNSCRFSRLSKCYWIK